MRKYNRRFHRNLFIVVIIIMGIVPTVFAGTTSKLSNIFTLDTREVNPNPVDGWQTLTYQGNSYNEDMIIDNHGKVWCFYYNSPGSHQPAYMKIFTSSGHLYKFKTTVGYSSSFTEVNYNTIRAALNSSTGDVWVAIQGADGGYFVVYDSTGNVKQDSTLLSYNCYLPKITSDKDGKMWFSWHTDIATPVESNVVIACYDANGEIYYTPQNLNQQTGVFNTDIAVDDSNRVWVTYDVNYNGSYVNYFSIINNDLDLFLDGSVISQNENILNPQRTMYSDFMNQRMWILEKNLPSSAHNLHLFSLDGTKITTIENVGECGFTRNEANQLEVIRFNAENPTNKVYEVALFNPRDGSMISAWQTLFDSTYQFVKNGIAYNRNYNTTKAYIVNKDESLTKVKFQVVNPGQPEISVNPTAINFDTTKIKATYKKQRLITIQNSGNEILQVYNIYSSDVRFTVSDTSFQLLPWQSKNVIIEFAPTDTFEVNAIIEVTSNDQNNSSVEINVSGKGYNPTDPQIAVSSSILIFNEVVIGASEQKYLFINNLDKYEPLKIFSITNSDTQFTVNRTNFTVNPSSGEWIVVTFAPTIASELITDSLIIENNDPDTSNYIVPIIASSREPKQPQIVVNPDSLYFGEVGVDDQTTMVLAISNRGEASLEISGITSNMPQFSVNRTEFTVTANDTEYVNITFNPTSDDIYNGKLTIMSNDPEHPELNVPVTGIGVVLNDPYLVYDKTELNFGKIQIGDTLKKSILLQNYGDRILEIFNISVSDTNFFVEKDTIRIAKQESYYLWVMFIPHDTLDYKAVLAFNSNDPNHQTVEINLYGKGEPNFQQLIVSWDSIDFGNVLIHSQVIDSLLISNIGNRLLTVSNIISSNPHFIPNITDFTLSSEQTKKLYITFLPDSVKKFEGKLTIVSNDPVADSIEVQLTGVGRDSTSQHIVLSSDSLNFDTVAKNTTKVLSLVVHNTGERKLNIVDIENSLEEFTLSRKQFDVNGLSFETLYVNFTPSDTGSFSDTLRIINNDPENDTAFVFLKGTGRNPLPQKIEVSTERIEFGNVVIGRSSTKSFWIYNRGEKDLNVYNVATTNSQFSVSDPWFIIKSLSSKYFVVTYTPENDSTVVADLILSTNDPNNQEVRIELSGTGVDYKGPQAVIFPEVLNFGNTLLGVTRQLSFKIFNFSDISALDISDYVLNNEFFRVTYIPESVSPQDSGFIRVVFQPQTENYHYGTLTLYTNDEYHSEYNLYLYGSGVLENPGQNTLAYWGWNENGSAPFGDGFINMVNNYTDNVLSKENDQAWFIKDVYLYEYPDSNYTYMNLCFKNRITVVINNTLVFDSTATDLEYWNKQELNVSKYLTIGRNRIAVTVTTENNKPNGGFDCELWVNGSQIVGRGDQNWQDPEARWWYFYSPDGVRAPVDTLQNRFWFARDYAITGIDSVTANWNFEPNGSDTLYDNSPYGHLAILRNVTWIEGIVGKAMEFRQNDSYVELSGNLNLLPLSIEFWLNCDGAENYRQTVISNQGGEGYGHGLFIEPDLRLGVYFYDGEFVFPDFILEPNSWNNISVQYNFDTSLKMNIVTVFVNGNAIGSYEYDPAYPSANGNKFYLAKNPLNPEERFFGALDELKVKNTASGVAVLPEIANIQFRDEDRIIARNDTNISFIITPSPFKIISGKFTYYHVGSSENDPDAVIDTTFWNTDSTYDSPLVLTIPSSYLDIRGVAFSLYLETNFGIVFYPEHTPGELAFDFLKLRTTQETANLILAPKNYRMISVPYELQEANIDSVLVDDFGPYDPYRWRLFDWVQSDTNFYVEYNTPQWDPEVGFKRGKAFWLVTDRMETFDAGNGQTPDQDDFPVILKPGWNMIANPFPYSIRWGNVQKSDIDQIDDPYFYTTIDSIGWVSIGENIPILPWEGYFIWNGDTVNQSIIVPAIESSVQPLKKQMTIKEQYQEKYRGLKILVKASVKSGKYFDHQNLFGVSKYASDGYDKYDSPEMPGMGEYISLWVDHRDWKEKGRAYTIDFMKSGKNGYSWNLVLESAIKDNKNPIIMSFNEICEIPENWQIYLFDVKEDVAYNLKEQNRISLKPEDNSTNLKYFKLVIGTEDYIKGNSDDIPLVPMEFELKQNYPNPFNSSTTITFSLPKRMKVNVHIFNILGQKVRTFVNDEMRGGLHKIIWDGRNDQGNILPTGLYFVRIEGQKMVDVKKMLLIK